MRNRLKGDAMNEFLFILSLYFQYFAEMVHKEVVMFEPKLRQISAGISGLAQDLQSKMKTY